MAKLKPTKKQMAVLRKMQSGLKLVRFDQRDGGHYYLIGVEKVHANTAMSLEWNKWVTSYKNVGMPADSRCYRCVEHAMTTLGQMHAQLSKEVR